VIPAHAASRVTTVAVVKHSVHSGLADIIYNKSKSKSQVIVVFDCGGNVKGILIAMDGGVGDLPCGNVNGP